MGKPIDFGHYVKLQCSQEWLLTIHMMLVRGEDMEHIKRCTFIAMDEERQRQALRAGADEV